ncbi:hypothetical protein [Funiculus sociatus]|uniref:hypothetical protein n=1 Tax=Funiculus sociatus TaxID=450527 RepID=UPI003299CC40
MRFRTRRRIKNIAIGAIAVSCAVGIVTLLVQPRELGKGMLLGFGFGLCCGIRLTDDQ